MTPESQRQRECPLRRERGTCGDIDVALGWKDLLPLSKCDECWKLREAGAEAAARTWRRDHAELVILTVKAKGIETYPAPVRDAMMEKHLDCHEAGLIRSKLANAPPTPKPKVRWLWIDWYGVPWPQRPYIASRAAWTAFRRAFRQLSASGCGCIARLKDSTQRRTA